MTYDEAVAFIRETFPDIHVHEQTNQYLRIGKAANTQIHRVVVPVFTHIHLDPDNATVDVPVKTMIDVPDGQGGTTQVEGVKLEQRPMTDDEKTDAEKVFLASAINALRRAEGGRLWDKVVAESPAPGAS